VNILEKSSIERLPKRLLINLEESNFLKFANLNADFVNETKKASAFLMKAKEECEAFDSNDRAHEDQISFIESTKDKLFPKLDQHFGVVWGMVEMFSEQEYRAHQLFYQKELLPFFYTPPLNTRIYDKPLGYDGDFQMMKYYYEDDYCGRSTYEKLMHRYTLSIPVSLATMERIEYISRWIKKCVSSDNRIARIMSLGSGPALEVIKFIEENPGVKAHFTLLDTEKLAIEHVERQIEMLGEKSRNCDVKCLNFDVLKFIKLINRDRTLRGQDLIYATGLFDYLNDKLAAKLLEASFSLLAGNGMLGITNLTHAITHRAYIEFLGEWKLIYRTKEDILRLCASLPQASKRELVVDKETQTKFYLEVYK